MKPENEDPQLRGLLQEWKTPAFSPDFEDRVLRARQTWWSTLWTSYIRIPVPVAFGAGLLLAVGMWQFVEVSRASVPCQNPGIAATAPNCQSDRSC